MNYATNTLDQYTSFSGAMSSSMSYDNNGNLGIFGSRVHTYDYNNRLIQINNWASSLIKYTYDILGRRIQKIDDYGSPNNPTTTIYIYAWDNIISEYRTIGVATGSGWTGTLTPLTLKKNYINWLWTDQLIAYDAEEQLTATWTNKVTNRYYYHLNQLWSVIALSTNTGAIAIRYSYDSFGYPRVIQWNWTWTTLTDFRNYTGNKYSNLRLFTWREHDRETGYYYHRARYTHPELLGRFISRDPIWQNDQVNLYTYVRNSPLNYTDKDGKKASAAIADTLDWATDIIIQTTSFIDQHRFAFWAWLTYVWWVLTTWSAGLCASSVSITTGCVWVTIVWWPVMAVCAPTGVVAWWSCAIAWVRVAMMAKGTQMMAESNGGGSKWSSNQDKVAWKKELEKIANREWYSDIHALKKDFWVNDSKIDAFFKKDWELYFKRKPLKNEEYEPVFTNYFK